MAVDDETKLRVDLYKTEYNVASTRYDNIYKSVWQNFSYMSALAGAVLVFGKQQFSPEVTGLLACIPLILWYWSCFEPLNFYGDQTARRLGELEDVLTLELGVGFFTEPNGTRLSDQELKDKRLRIGGLRHYNSFIARAEAELQGNRATARLIGAAWAALCAVGWTVYVRSASPNTADALWFWKTLGGLIFGALFGAGVVFLLRGCVAIIFGEGLPQVTKQPQNAQSNGTQDATFQASAKGSQSIQWQVSQDHGVSFVNITGANKYALEVAKGGPNDIHGNVFRAIFSNSRGAIETFPAVLTTEPKPLDFSLPQRERFGAIGRFVPTLRVRHMVRVFALTVNLFAISMLTRWEPPPPTATAPPVPPTITSTTTTITTATSTSKGP